MHVPSIVKTILQYTDVSKVTGPWDGPALSCCPRHALILGSP